MSTDREDLFFSFLARLEATNHAQERGPQMLKAIVEAFETCHPARSSLGHERLPNFEDAIFNEPFTVYLIRNTITGRAYVGRALHGFVVRYPHGQWWASDAGRDEHHNERLAKDALLFGLSAFHVHIHVCNDAEHMGLVESQLIAAHRRCTYNILPEPTIVAVTPQTWEEQTAAAEKLQSELKKKHGIEDPNG